MISNIQLLRFLAAFGVAVMHVGLINGDTFFPSGIVGVDVFFVISGFIMTTITWNKFGRPGECRNFLYRRLSRIVPLYWIATLALFFLSLWERWITLFPPTSEVISKTIFGMLFIPVYKFTFLPPGWTLNFEMLFYVLFGVAMLVNKPIAISTIIGVLVVLAGIGEFSGLSTDPTISWGFAQYWLSPLFLEFVWGMIIGIIYARGIRLTVFAAGIGCIVGVWLIVYAGSFPAIQYREFVIGIPAALLLMGAVSLPQIPVYTRVGRLSMLLGDTSYSLYLTHWILFICVRDLPVYLLLALAVAAAVIVRLAIEAPILELLISDRDKVRPGKSASVAGLPG